MNRRENILRAVRFDRPETIPVHVSINNACWSHYPQHFLQELMAEHKLLFPDYVMSHRPMKPHFAPFRIAGLEYTDSWGVVWRTLENGITGTVIKHALPTWDKFSTYVAPDPEKHYGWGEIDWEEETERITDAFQKGRIAKGSLRHGHTFLTLVYIRGYESLLYDMVDGEPNLERLLAMVEDFNLALVRHYINLGVEWMSYPEDLGMQQGPMLSPTLFRRYIKPVYRKLMAPALEAGCVIHMHSDGDIRTLVPDILECGVDVLNLQDQVNGLEWIREHIKTRMCIDLDIDRQRITRFGSPVDVDNLIRYEVEILGDPQGGLMLQHDLMPGIPLENVKALMDALERYAGYFG
jgi:uroporphyrinogen decarboxylase